MLEQMKRCRITGRMWPESEIVEYHGIQICRREHNKILLAQWNADFIAGRLPEQVESDEARNLQISQTQAGY